MAVVYGLEGMAASGLPRMPQIDYNSAESFAYKPKGALDEGL